VIAIREVIKTDWKCSAETAATSTGLKISVPFISR
jgi:hypothetical protein